MSESVASYLYTRVEATDAELEKYKACFAKNGTERSLENLQWLHQQNLAGTNMIYYAIYSADGSIAGIYTALPTLVRIHNKVLPGLQSIDTLTDEDHRGKGLFIKLAKQLYADAAKTNFELVYGFPNGNSAPGFFKKLEWKSFGEAPFMIKPLRLGYVIRKLLKKNKESSQPDNSNRLLDLPATYSLKDGQEFRIIEQFGAPYDELWEKAAQTTAVTINRDSRFMNWRYFDKPEEVYYRYGLYDRSKNLLGIVVFSLKNKHDGVVGYLMELIYDPLNTEAGKLLLKTTSKILRRNKADVILAWCLPHSYNFVAYKKAGYFILPNKLKPQKLFCGVRALNEEKSKAIENINNWYISYSDSDTA